MIVKRGSAKNAIVKHLRKYLYAEDVIFLRMTKRISALFAKFKAPKLEKKRQIIALNVVSQWKILNAMSVTLYSDESQLNQ